MYDINTWGSLKGFELSSDLLISLPIFKKWYFSTLTYIYISICVYIIYVFLSVYIYIFPLLQPTRCKADTHLASIN